MLDETTKIRAIVSVAYIVAIVMCVILGLNGVPQELATH
jgi:hypothetical protein